jgi:choline dehydrogenase
LTLGMAGWSADELLPLFREANRRMRVRSYRPEEITPFHDACLQAATEAGVPAADDLNDLDADEGIAASPVNIVDGVRWNAAFAYLDPVRHRPGLTILGKTPVSHIIIDGQRVTGVAVVMPSGIETVAAGRVVVSAGAYESPTILLRSGIGDPDTLRAVGVDPRHPLPGVGQNLHDHPSVRLAFAGSAELIRRMEAFAGEGWMPEEQTIAKLRSPLYPSDQAGFDLHVYPVGGPEPGDGGWHWYVPVACMTPAIPRLGFAALARSPGPAADRPPLPVGPRWPRRRRARRRFGDRPRHRGVFDAGGPAGDRDRAGTRGPDAGYGCGLGPPDGRALLPSGRHLQDGPRGRPMAVCDPRGKVYGFDNLYVADCSLMPVIPRANTNIPAVVVGERIGRLLLDGNTS